MNNRQFGRAVLALAVVELRLTLRRGESVLVTVLIPAALLVFFATARVLPSDVRTIDFLLPGTLALAVISTGFVSLGIATCYERQYGVLKLFGAAPLPRSGLVAAKMLSVAVLETAQIALLGTIAAIGFGWRPHGSIFLALCALLLGASAFAGLGMLMAGSLRAEATLGLANGVFLFFLLLGGLYVPIDHLPAWIEPVSRALPATALAGVLRSVLMAGAPIPPHDLIVLALWATISPAAAALTFRWE